MKSYKSHKVVQAAKISAAERTYQAKGGEEKPWGARLAVDGGLILAVDEQWLAKHTPSAVGGVSLEALIGGYLVAYPDGYLSWSPAGVFEEGYAEASLDPKDGALPVSGYKPQTGAKVDMVNGFKADEERLLRKLDAMADMSATEVDRRWMAIGRTALEQAFMAINRSVFQPGRVKLPEDTVAEPEKPS